MAVFTDFSFNHFYKRISRYLPNVFLCAIIFYKIKLNIKERRGRTLFDIPAVPPVTIYIFASDRLYSNAKRL